MEDLRELLKKIAEGQDYFANNEFAKELRECNKLPISNLTASFAWLDSLNKSRLVLIMMSEIIVSDTKNHYHYVCQFEDQQKNIFTATIDMSWGSLHVTLARKAR